MAMKRSTPVLRTASSASASTTMPAYSYNFILRTAFFLAAVGILVLRNVYEYRDLRVISKSLKPIDTMHSVGLTTRSVLEEDDRTIRSWGCNITATPFIFVHIGKAGGGNVRRRLATAALNFTRSKKYWASSQHDDHAYPVHHRVDGSKHRAKFCSSRRHRHLPTFFRSFEGHSQRCTATTPLGHILACPEIFDTSCPYDPSDPESAHLVYAGHNYFGTEINWLPAPYLEDWWNKHWSTGPDDEVAKMIPTLDGVTEGWCGNLTRPVLLDKNNREKHLEAYDCAQQHLDQRVDDLSDRALQQRFGGRLETDLQKGRAQGQVYASLPVTRVTVMREPISWLNSKYHWHHLKGKKLKCDNITQATYLPGGDDYTNEVLSNHQRPGWARLMPLSYILYICGEDCLVRLEAGRATLAEIEAQAAYNLRNSFAVVGLLQEQDTFFEMIHARVDYMDMHSAVKIGGGNHKSKKDAYCDGLFKNKNYMEQLVAASPELQAMIRLYDIALEVNRFHMQELQQCSGTSLSPQQ